MSEWMLIYEWLGFFIVFFIGFALVSGPIRSNFPQNLLGVIIGGYLMRPIGSLMRYFVLYTFYDGGDAGKYYRTGLYFAEYIWDLDFSFLSLPAPHTGNAGTEFVMYLSGFVVSFLGPTRRGGFFFFAILSFIGLLLFLKAFQMNYPRADLRRYAKWLFLWPSLWFWPSSIGKDALILLATASVVYGFCGNRIRWFSLVFGLFLAGLIRPHVAGVLILSLLIAHLVLQPGRWTPKRIFQGVVLMLIAGVVLWKGAARMGFVTDYEGVTSFIDDVRQGTAGGGSEIEAPGIGISSVPMAFVNILMRPFPWEARSPVTAAAALEMMLLWFFVWRRRRNIARLAKEWRHHRILRLALPLTFLYVLMLGMAFGNLGMIARQRIHILQMLFLWFEAIPQFVTVKRVVPVVRPGVLRYKQA